MDDPQYLLKYDTNAFRVALENTTVGSKRRSFNKNISRFWVNAWKSLWAQNNIGQALQKPLTLVICVWALSFVGDAVVYWLKSLWHTLSEVLHTWINKFEKVSVIRIVFTTVVNFWYGLEKKKYIPYLRDCINERNLNLLSKLLHVLCKNIL